MKLKHEDMHYMHATFIFYRNSNNTDMTKIKHFCAPAPPRDPQVGLKYFFLLSRKKSQ